ncbi:MAG: helix-turn-helix transcriptional regulator [Bergeyella sp.]
MKLDLDKIRSVRIQKGFSQEYVADVLEISQAKYSRLESGKIEITLREFCELISLLGLNSSDIIIKAS